MKKSHAVSDFSERSLSVKEAAKMLGVSERRIHQYIQSGRLPAYPAGRDIQLPLEGVMQFKPGIIGRPRKKSLNWRGSFASNPARIAYIRVQVYPGQTGKLVERLQTIKREKRYLFPGMMTSYISLEDGQPAILTIQIVWKHRGVGDQIMRGELFAGFKAELADVLDWQTAHYSTGAVIIHT